MKKLITAFRKLKTFYQTQEYLALAEEEMLALALALEITDLNQLLVLPNIQGAEQIYADLKLLMKLRGLKDTELLFLPEIQLGRSQFQPDLEAQRNATLKRMLGKNEHLVVLASAAALTSPVVRPALFEDEGLELTLGRTDLEPRVLADL